MFHNKNVPGSAPHPGEYRWWTACRRWHLTFEVGGIARLFQHCPNQTPTSALHIRADTKEPTSCWGQSSESHTWLPSASHPTPQTSDIPGGSTLNTSQGVCCTHEEIRKMMDVFELAQEVLLPAEPSPHPASSDRNLQVHSPEMVSGTETNWAYYLECDWHTFKTCFKIFSAHMLNLRTWNL